MLVLPEHLEFPTKNPIWEDQTPNERYRDDPDYYLRLNAWALKNHIPGRRFFEVRITKVNSILSVHQSSAWWDQPSCMDHIFWVFQKPITLGVGLQIYSLELYECRRVVEMARKKLGYNPFPSEEPSLCVPVDCVEMAWNETANGYSDHIRHRETKEVSQRQADLQGVAREEVEKIIEQIKDVSDDPRYQ